MAVGTLKCATTYYRVERRQISFLRFIFEAYEGIAIVTTIDAGKGVVAIRIPPGCEPVVQGVLANLAKEILIERIDGNRETSRPYHRLPDERG